MDAAFIVAKYDDKNGNGLREYNELGLSWDFEWDLNGDNNWRAYVTYASKNGEGGRVGGLTEGDRVRVREKAKDGWVATTATQVEFTVHTGYTAYAAFGNRATKPTVQVGKTVKTLPKTGFDTLPLLATALGTGLSGLYLRRKYRRMK